MEENGRDKWESDLRERIDVFDLFSGREKYLNKYL